MPAVSLVLGLAVTLVVEPRDTWAEAPLQGQQELWTLDFVGNHALSDGEIEDAISSSASSHFPIFGKKRLFDPVVFETDQRRIEHLYKRHGYYQAVIEKAVVVSCGDNRVCATITINEGAPTRIASIGMKVSDSHPLADQASLLSVFRLKPGDVFDHDRYMAGKNALINSLKEKAYPFPKVNGQAVYRGVTNDIAVELHLMPGTKARIGRVGFEGLHLVREEDAESRLPVRSGDWYNPRKVEDAQLLIADLDVFQTIEPEVRPRPSDPGLVDLTFHVHEKKLKTLQLGVGIRTENSRQEARLIGEWTDRNFFKHLRKFRVLGEPRYAVLPSIFRPEQYGPLGTLQVSMDHPSFFSPWQNLHTLAAFDSDLEQGFRWFGPRVAGSIDRRIARRLSMSAGYAFRYLTFYDVDLGTFDPLSRLVPPELLFGGKFRLGFLNQRFSWDMRDQAIEPSSGFFAETRFEEAAPIFASAFSYFRSQPEFRFYVPMSRRAALAIRALHGYLAPFAGQASPITERFYGGGANDHRGFGYHRLSPQVTASDGRRVPVGGNIEVFFSAEERIKLFTIGDRWLIGGLFADAGDVVEDPKDLDLGLLHYAVGTGLRYETPVGVIRADVGFRLNRTSDATAGRPNPDPGENYAVHVSIGEAF